VASRDALAKQAGHKGYKGVNLPGVLYNVGAGKDQLEEYLGYIIFGQKGRVLQITDEFIIYEHSLADTRGITAWMKKKEGMLYYRNQELKPSQYLVRDFTNYVNNAMGTSTGLIIEEVSLDDDKNLFEPYVPIELR